MKYYLYKCISIVFWLAKWVFSIVFFAALIGLAIPHLNDSDQYSYLKHVIAFNQQISALIHQYLPTRFGNKDITPYIALVISFIGSIIMGNYRYEFDFRARRSVLQKTTEKFKELATTEEGAKKVALLDQQMKKIENSSRKEREALLKEYASIKKELESMGRNMAFLSIDVVDSTGMKQGEDPLIVAHDFTEYRKLVEGKLNAHGAVKQAWTPDGMMACFNTLEEAVSGAQSILTALPDFNRRVKGMKRDINVRCGVNAGYLLFDDTLPLEHITDRVIDIAGHMQKYAKPNSIFIAKNIIAPVKQPENFRDAAKVIDDLEVCMWDPTHGTVTEQAAR